MVWKHHNKSKYTRDSDSEENDSERDSYDSSGFSGSNGRKNRTRTRKDRSHKNVQNGTPDLSLYGNVTTIVPDDISDDGSISDEYSQSDYGDKYQAPQKVGIYAPGATFNITLNW